MIIEVQNLQKQIPLRPSRITHLVRNVLVREGVQTAVLSIAVVTDGRIRALNKTFLRRDRTTDVLAFDFKEDTPARACRNTAGRTTHLEGEIVVSATTAVKNAKRYGVPSYSELMLYVIHGLLHLLGYDDHASRDRGRMRRKERELMAAVAGLLPEGKKSGRRVGPRRRTRRNVSER